MILIEDYIRKPQHERQAHLVLSEPCVERGGNSHQARGLLAHVLDTTIPKGMKIHLCHACNNGHCMNPNHLYWGTAKENMDDSGVRELAHAASKNRVPWNKGLRYSKKYLEELAESA